MSDVPAKGPAARVPIDVVVVGSLNMDLIATVPRLPVPGETLIGLDWSTACGGKGANQAVAAARLGARVAMIGRVGRDAHGSGLIEALAADGIDIDCVLVDETAPTGIALITVDALGDQQGQNTIVVIPGANGHMTPANVEALHARLAETKFVVCQLEAPMATVQHVVELARALGKTVVFNPAPVPSSDHDRAIISASLMKSVDLMIPNETEAALLSGLPVRNVVEAHAAAGELRDRGCKEVIVTLGKQGLVHADSRGSTHFPAQVVDAIDATAAGDTFIGGLVAALARGASMGDAIAFGQAAAAIAVTRRGAQPSIPTRAEVEKELP